MTIDYEPVLATLRANLAGTIRLRAQHRPDVSGRCPVCRCCGGCTLYRLADRVVREHGVTGH